MLTVEIMRHLENVGCRLSFEGTQQHPISSSSSRGFGPESGSEPVENNGTAVADSSTLEHDKREGKIS